MTQLQFLIKFLKSLPEFSKDTGYSIPHLLWSYMICYIVHGSDSEKFRALRLYEYSNKKRSEFILNRGTKKYMNIFNAGATPEEFAQIGSKELFNTTFREFIHRDWLYIPDSSPEEIRAFIARNDVFLVKDTGCSGGKNIFRFTRQETDVDAFLREHQDKPVLLEAFVRQHPALAALNPTTLNTVRIHTIRRDDRVMAIGACLRAGGATAFVDNFHSGGVAYPIDTDTGVILGDGRNLLGQMYRRHPSTGYYMPGFQIPFWDELLDTVRKAAVIVPHVGYVGWDVAITPEGPELIEGNVMFPDSIVLQLDGNGIRQKVQDFADGKI